MVRKPAAEAKTQINLGDFVGDNEIIWRKRYLKSKTDHGFSLSHAHVENSSSVTKIWVLPPLEGHSPSRPQHRGYQ